jgi:hypothetical protein
MAKAKIAVIGLGPSGAFAAKAAHDMGCDVDIYTTTTNKMPPGATWLHWLPEDVTSRFTPTQIYIMGKGTEKEYVKRQWGSDKISSSFPKKPVWEAGFNPTEVLDVLVPDACHTHIVPHPMSDVDVKDLSRGYDLVFQTFATQESKNFQPPLVSFVAAASIGRSDPEKNFVVYNGTKDGIVVREAQLFGNHFLEFPKNMSIQEVRELHPDDGKHSYISLKDLDASTKPWLEDKSSKVKLVGRWAQWDRKVLSHDAYKLVQKYIKELE